MAGSANAGFDIFDEDLEYEKRTTATIDASDFIVDIREYDVPYHVRVAIDKGTYCEEC
jgi:DNA polymerase epsilon subunit 1